MDVEEIYLKCFEIAPARLGWRTRPEIPDYKKISKALQSVEAKTHTGEGENFSSFGVYLSTSPILRSHGQAVYSLAGVHPSEDEIATVSRLGKSSFESLKYSYGFEGTNVVLSVTPSIPGMQGVIIIDQSLYEMVVSRIMVFECECGMLATEQLAKISSGRFWTGFTAVFKHGLDAHSMTVNSEFDLLIDFDQDKVILRQ